MEKLENAAVESNEIQKMLYEQELSLLSAEVRTSTEALDKLLDDEFVEYGSSGKEYMKDIILERLPTSEPIQYEVTNFHTYELSKDVIQTRFVTDRKNLDGTHTVSLRSSIWRNNNGSWQMLYHQGTPIDSE